MGSRLPITFATVCILATLTGCSPDNLEPDAPQNPGNPNIPEQSVTASSDTLTAIAGRPMADLDDVRAVAPAVLRHRLVTNFAAEAADRTSGDLVRELVGGKAWLGG